MLPDLWREIDDAVLECLAGGESTPAGIGQRLGMSEAAAMSIVAMLAAEGKVRICRVALTDSWRTRQDAGTGTHASGQLSTLG